MLTQLSISSRTLEERLRDRIQELSEKVMDLKEENSNLKERLRSYEKEITKN